MRFFKGMMFFKDMIFSESQMLGGLVAIVVVVGLGALVRRDVDGDGTATTTKVGN